MLEVEGRNAKLWNINTIRVRCGRTENYTTLSLKVFWMIIQYICYKLSWSLILKYIQRTIFFVLTGSEVLLIFLLGNPKYIFLEFWVKFVGTFYITNISLFIFFTYLIWSKKGAEISLYSSRYFLSWKLLRI